MSDPRMDFVNKLVGQAAERFRAMSTGARVTAGSLAAVVVIGLAFLVRAGGGGADVYLMEGESFSPGQVNVMIAAFGSANLNAYEIEGCRIRVPRGQQAAYMAALAAKNALPQKPLDYLDRAGEGNFSFLADRHQREMRTKLEKQRVLSAIIAEMPGVETATVLWDEEQKPGLLKPTERTASVSVKMQGSAELEETQAEAIRRLVAKSIAGLKYETVLVMDHHGRTFFGSGDGSGASDDSWRDCKRADEKEWRAKILRALAWIPGVSVEVNADLDKERSSRQREVRPDSRTAQAADRNRFRANYGTGPGSASGLMANQPASLALMFENQEEDDWLDCEGQGETAATQKDTVTVGMTTRRVTATVGVPTRYFEEVWRGRNACAVGVSGPPPQSELDQVRLQETDKIKKCVAALLPPTDDVTDLAQLVTVTEFQNIAPTMVTGPELNQPQVHWLARYWTALAVGALALLGVLFVRRVLRNAPPASPEATWPIAASRGSIAEEVEIGTAARQRWRDRLATGGPSLTDDLSHVVAEDPDTAANILRNWIGNATTA